MTIRDD
jgi:hypothetical protein